MKTSVKKWIPVALLSLMLGTLGISAGIPMSIGYMWIYKMSALQALLASIGMVVALVILAIALVCLINQVLGLGKEKKPNETIG